MGNIDYRLNYLVIDCQMVQICLFYHIKNKMASSIDTMDDHQQNRRRGSRADSMTILEDFGDRLNSVYTPLLLLLLAAITLMNVYFFRPVSCTVSHYFKNHQITQSYAESVCWSQGVVGINVIDELPNDDSEWEKIREKSETCEFFFSGLAKMVTFYYLAFIY